MTRDTGLHFTTPELIDMLFFVNAFRLAQQIEKAWPVVMKLEFIKARLTSALAVARASTLAHAYPNLESGDFFLILRSIPTDNIELRMKIRKTITLCRTSEEFSND